MNELGEYAEQQAQQLNGVRDKNVDIAYSVPGTIILGAQYVSLKMMTLKVWHKRNIAIFAPVQNRHLPDLTSRQPFLREDTRILEGIVAV